MGLRIDRRTVLVAGGVALGVPLASMSAYAVVDAIVAACGGLIGGVVAERSIAR